MSPEKEIIELARRQAQAHQEIPCPRCGRATRREHADNRCTGCGWVVRGCEPDPVLPA